MSQSEDANILRCFCDHCPNNTCITSRGIGLCYAEWLPKNLQLQAPIAQQSSQLNKVAFFNMTSPLLATSSSPEIVAVNHHVANQMTNTNTGPLELEKRYNCYNKNDPLFLKTIICNETVSDNSKVIRRCCSSGDYCNRNDTLLPNQEEATKLFEHYYPRQHLGWLGDMVQQYSSMPLGYKILINIALILLIASLIALAKNSATLRRKHRRATSTTGNSNQENVGTTSSSAIKQLIVRIIGLQRLSSRDINLGGSSSRRRQTSRIQDQGPGRSERKPLAQTSSMNSNPKPSTTHQASPAPPTANGHVRPPSGPYIPDVSDNTSYNKANSEAFVFDSNSMASREPLIRSSMHLRPAQHPLNQHHPGPYMSEEMQNNIPQYNFHMTIGSAASEFNKNDSSSGSGAGQPYLTQRSIANDIELVDIVGRGFYGIVWRGEYKGEPVAVKIFSPIAERSWEREAEIYQTTMLRHKNILGFIATDKRYDQGVTGFWLVTDYYPMGSLYDFLKDNSMSMADAVRMAFSIANGLSHLHMEIFGTRGKPAIAHRDMKSKNILVKNDGTCCIADLGMAVRYNSSTGIVDVPTNTRAGTRRYLAPEILANKLNMMDFEGVKQTDIYAMGLVLWEILRRACVEPEPEPPQGGPQLFQSPQPAQPPQPSPTPGPEGPPKPSQGAHPSPVAGRLSREPQTSQASRQSSLDPKASPTSRRSSQGPQASPVSRRSTSQPPQAAQRASQEPQASQPPHQSPAQDPQPSQPSPPTQSMPNFQTSTNSTYDPNGAYTCDPYEVPYFNVVSNDPSFEEMREMIYARKIRPSISVRWTKFASMRDYTNIMSECWYEKSQARLSALRVRKSLSDIAKKYFNMKLEYD